MSEAEMTIGEATLNVPVIKVPVPESDAVALQIVPDADGNALLLLMHASDAQRIGINPATGTAPSTQPTAVQGLFLRPRAILAKVLERWSTVTGITIIIPSGSDAIVVGRQMTSMLDREHAVA